MTAKADPSLESDLCALSGLLAEARRRGFLGRVPPSDHIDHALGFAEVVGAPPADLIDLGSGAGLPGLVLALRWRGARVTLVDSNARRTALLEEAVARLRIGGRVQVRTARAEALGHDMKLRGSASLVTARAFAKPSATAECAAGLLAIGGRLVVSEPPAASWGAPGTGAGPEPLPGRWPAALAVLGLWADAPSTARGYGFQLLVQVEPCPARYPRRDGVPAKRPLFT
ncbi:MAG: 16S rRNA (guanine(527)-N(7))-methyltransferase RsmG [Acidimicrobiales bacterium]